MPTYVAFLRAINVTGRFVKMSELAAAFHQAGHVDARTYINSGNVIFASAIRSAARLERGLEEELEPLLGFRSEVFVRTSAEVKTIAARALALRRNVAPRGEVNVCFLHGPVTAAHAAEIEKLKTGIDDFEFGGREIYWLCLTTQSGSRFSNATLERRLGVRSTLRRGSMLNGLADEV